MTTIIKGANIVVPGGISAADILVENGIITKIERRLKRRADNVINANGLTAMPAFVDMHCHLRDPGQTHKEDIQSGARSALRGGYRAVCCMPNTLPPVDNAAMVYYVACKGRETDIKVLPIGAITKGLKGKELAEIGFMQETGAIAFSDDGFPVENGAVMSLALEYTNTFGTLLISHCEDRNISGNGVVNEGANASQAGLRGIPRAAEEVMIARDIILAENKGARLHIAHVSTRIGVELIRQAKQRGVRITCETCPHYFAATDAEILNYNTNAKINPPLRTADDISAIISGLADGTIDAISTDHAPHHADEKNQEFDNAPFGTVGFETAFAVSYTYLVAPGHITLNQLSLLMSRNPSDILGIGGGIIANGSPADIILIDINEEYTVNADNFVSKSKNSVFNGWKLSGAVKSVILSGIMKIDNR